MHIMTNPKKVLASAVISELQSSDMYLTLVARLFDLRANLNGVRVTEAFLDEIVENESRYICHPLYADIRGLLANKNVGHMYNSRTGEFYTTQIGAFYHFEKEIENDNTYLLGYARVPKRNKALCKVLSDLFANNALKFSFEVNCGAYSEEADGTLLIDEDERNYWEGECVVTFPACEMAIAKQLVAECLSKGDEDIVDIKILESEAVIAESKATIAETAITETAENQEIISTEELTAETVYVTQQHTEVDEARAYNCDTGEESVQRIVIETTMRTPIELAEAEDEDEDKPEEEKCNAEISNVETEVVAESKEDEEDEEKEDEEKKEVAESTSDLNKIVAELFDAVQALRNEIAELKTTTVATPETSDNTGAATITAEMTTEAPAEDPVVNPFMASITAPQKYSLLNKEEKSVRKYSLLERA